MTKLLFFLILFNSCFTRFNSNNSKDVFVYEITSTAYVSGLGDLEKKFFRVASFKERINDRRIEKEFKYILKLVKKRGRIITKKRYDDNELFKYIIKNGLPKNEYLDNQPYQIAIIYQKDTLYTNTHLNIWRWNNEKSYNYYHSNVFAKLIY